MGGINCEWVESMMGGWKVLEDNKYSLIIVSEKFILIYWIVIYHTS